MNTESLKTESIENGFLKTETMKNGPSNIASLVVQFKPSHANTVLDNIAARDYASIENSSHDRAVVLLEVIDARAISDCIDQLHALSGVLAVHLVYHYIEPAVNTMS